MTSASIDAKKLYEVNQYIKNYPYYYDLADHHFVSHDGQSDILVSAPTFKIEGLTVPNRYLFIEDGKALFAFLTEHKKGNAAAVKEAMATAKLEGRKLSKEDKEEIGVPTSLTLLGIECNGSTFPVKFTDKIDLPLISNEPKSSLKKLDCATASLHYESEMLKDGNVSINDIIEVIGHKKSQVDNLIVFMEIINNEIHLYESKLGLTMQHKTLICLDNFNKLKNKKGEVKEYMHMHIGKNRLYISYGNSELDFIYKFHMHDLHPVSK